MKGYKFLTVLLVVAMVVSVASCAPKATPTPKPTVAPTAAPTAPPAKKLKIGWVLHVPVAFTDRIKAGAVQAGKEYGVEVEVVAPSKYDPEAAISLFEGFVAKKVDGLAVVPQPGETWVKPINAAMDAGIPVMTANVTALESKAPAWFGQDEYNSGRILAQELLKILQKKGITKGKIVVGGCVPGIKVLTDRYDGFMEVMKAYPDFKVSQFYDVTSEVGTNYSAWESLYGANPDMTVAVGLCSIDIPNLAKLKQKTGAKFLVAGYDLNADTLDAIKAGLAEVTVGQNPYLQGYLPVRALVEHLRDGKPLVKGWVNVGTEAVTAENVESVYRRETDPAYEAEWYKKHIADNFKDLNALAGPMPR